MVMQITTAHGRVVDVNPDYTLDQNWAHFTPEEHDRWDRLYARQCRVLEGRAADAFLEGLHSLKLSDAGIPRFDELNERLMARTGWQVVAVPDLVPERIFFEHLANRLFPAGNFIRSEEQFDYIQEPDVFHDVFGHVPMLANPVFADFMQAYGQALYTLGDEGLPWLARIYWYTTEFGLLKAEDGFRIYGAGILSSPAESVFAVADPSPNRIHFDLERVLRTDYRVDDFQETYFVISDFDELLSSVNGTFAKTCERVRGLPVIDRGALVAGDRVYTRGTGAHARRVREAAIA